MGAMERTFYLFSVFRAPHVTAIFVKQPDVQFGWTLAHVSVTYGNRVKFYPFYRVV